MARLPRAPGVGRIATQGAERTLFAASRSVVSFLVIAAVSLLDAATLEVIRTESRPVIDGVIAAGEWDDAAYSSVFRQVKPLEDVEPSERTEMWVMFDDDNLYVAIRAHDSAGSAGIRAASMQSDGDNESNDMLRIVLDPFNRQNDGYYFAVNAVGARSDGLINDKDRASGEWDGIWEGKVSRDDGGWSAEFAIPAKTLSFDPKNGTWGFNASRSIQRKTESIRWSGFVRGRNSVSLPHAGTLTGVIGLKHGKGIDFKPYASFTSRSDPGPGEKKNEPRAGFDLVWHITPSLAATFTANTDFADAEVDARRINLGRFPLFFPEKRSFFLQDAPLFTFGRLRRDPLPFHSRRIGRSADGSKVDILGGMKLTGRLGRVSIGMLDVQTDDHLGLESKNLFVGRVAVDVLEESSTGVIVTNGDPRFKGDNTLVGADFNYTNNRLFNGKTLRVIASAQHTDSDARGASDTATVLTVEYPNEPFGMYSIVKRIGEDYDPALGFVPRRGVQEHILEGWWRWFPEQNGVRSFMALTGTFLTTDLRGRRLDVERWLDLSIETTGGSEALWLINSTSETLDEPFEIRPGIVIPAGRGTWNRTALEFSSNSSRPFSVHFEVDAGGFFDGRRFDYEFGLKWRPSVHFLLATDFEWTLVRLPQGRFQLSQNTTEAIVMINPDLQVGLLVQYDSFSREVGTNFRVRWTVRPGSDVYFVVNQGYDTSLTGLRPTRNESSLKGGWTFRF